LAAGYILHISEIIGNSFAGYSLHLPGHVEGQGQHFVEERNVFTGKPYAERGFFLLDEYFQGFQRAGFAGLVELVKPDTRFKSIASFLHN